MKVKEESEKAGLKLNIQKTKIMALILEMLNNKKKGQSKTATKVFGRKVKFCNCSCYLLPALFESLGNI